MSLQPVVSAEGERGGVGLLWQVKFGLRHKEVPGRQRLVAGRL